MSDLRTAAQQALEALSLALSDVEWRINSPTQRVIHGAYNNLRTSLAQEAKSLAGILLREHDNIEQAIRYAERMAQRCADSHSLMAMEYQDAAKELKAWKQSKPL